MNVSSEGGFFQAMKVSGRNPVEKLLKQSDATRVGLGLVVVGDGEESRQNRRQAILPRQIRHDESPGHIRRSCQANWRRKKFETGRARRKITPWFQIKSLTKNIPCSATQSCLFLIPFQYACRFVQEKMRNCITKSRGEGQKADQLLGNEPMGAKLQVGVFFNEKILPWFFFLPKNINDGSVAISRTEKKERKKKGSLLASTVAVLTGFQFPLHPFQHAFRLALREIGHVVVLTCQLQQPVIKKRKTIHQWLIHWLIDHSFDRLVTRLIDWSLGWLIDHSFDRLVTRSIDWLIGRWLIDWSLGWLIDWLVIIFGWPLTIPASRPCTCECNSWSWGQTRCRPPTRACGPE